MSCSGYWRVAAERYKWRTFIKAICKGHTNCSKFPDGCKQCLDKAEVTKIENILNHQCR